MLSSDDHSKQNSGINLAIGYFIVAGQIEPFKGFYFVLKRTFVDNTRIKYGAKLIAYTVAQVVLVRVTPIYRDQGLGR